MATMRWIGLVLAGLAIGAVVVRAADASGDTVYVSRNGSAYHLADCPRLRFERPIARTEAIPRYPACPVCRPDRQEQPAPAVVPQEAVAPPPSPAAASRTEAAEPARPAPVETSPSRKTGGGKGRWIGLAAGGGIGFLLGAVGAYNACPWNDANCGAGYILGFTAGGAAAGYFLGKALGGGGQEAAIDAAVERSHEEFRARRASEAAGIASVVYWAPMLQSPATPHRFLKKAPKRLAVVDQNACSGCAGSPSCVAFCETVTVKDAIVDAIRVVSVADHPFELAYIEFDKCIGCALCAQVCPWDAITMYDTAEAYDVLEQVTVRPPGAAEFAAAAP